MCRNCLKAKTTEYYGLFDMKCSGCRERLLMSEPCKVMREQMAKSMLKWGDAPDWKKEPSCGCYTRCKRKAAILEKP